MPSIPHAPCDNTGNLCEAMAYAWDAPERPETAMDNVVARCGALLRKAGNGTIVLPAECPIPGSATISKTGGNQ